MSDIYSPQMNSKVNTQLLIFMNEMKMKKCISAAHPQCLKITKKVSYNNDYISKVDKSSLKMPKMVNFGNFLKT